MISKKVLGPALTGTGAVGASGTLAWTLGLLDEEILEDVVVEERDVIKPEPEQQKNVSSDPEASAKQAEAAKETTKESKKDIPPNKEAQVGQKTQTGADGGSKGAISTRIAGPRTWSAYLANDGEATAFDRKVFDSDSTLEVEWNDGLHSIIVKVTKNDDSDFSWECRLKAIPIEDEIDSRNHEFEEFKRQKNQLEDAIAKDDHKKQLVTNCSRARSTEEKQRGGKDGVIELETESLTWKKYKFKEKENYFERLWTEDFTGVYRLSADDENIVKKGKNWNISWQREESETKGKVKVSLVGGGLTCSISGDYGRNLESRTFKDYELKEILNLNEYSGSKKEKKRYLIRNCRKNNGEIKGLKIKDLGGKQWDFDEASLEKISKGMYENPKAT